MEGEERTGWFHCGRCGAFFGAEVGVGVPESCPECGRDPVVDPSEIAFVQAAGSPVAKSSARRSDGKHADGHRHGAESKRKKERNGVAVFVGIWVVILITLAGAVKYFQGSDDGNEEGFGIMSAADQLISGEINNCKAKVMQLLDAGAPERRAEFVINPVESLRRMSSWRQDVSSSTDGEDSGYSVMNLINTPKGKAIESVWEFSGNRKFEAVFFEDEKGEWKIDWANMVRYSDVDWSLFLLGTEEEEGEFRLLARRRSEDSTGGGKVASVVLIGPRAEFPSELGASSPEVVVDPESRIGRILTEAFAKRDAGEGVYGSQASQLDPKGMIRLRVRVKREEGEERNLVIREVLACHWYDFDDLGLSE